MSTSTDLRSFTLRVSDEDLADLRDRLVRARLPEPETVRAPHGNLNWDQGPPLEYVVELLRYWKDSYDWRRLEAELNSHGQGMTSIDGVDIQFLHVRSTRPDARPLVLTHGWPSSLVEPLEVVDDLANPSSDNLPAFHVVAPSLPGFGFSGKPQVTGWTIDRIADAWAELMSRLGYTRYFAVGGDWGGRVTTALGVRFPERVAALHTFTPYVPIPNNADDDLSDTEFRGLSDTKWFRRFGGGYSLQQSTRPQTVAYSLVDSPVGQLTWILDKFWAWTDCDGQPESAVNRDRILDTVSMYWLSASGGSSARIYWENFPPEDSARVDVPSAVSIFPKDIERLPQRWVEARYRNLRYWHVLDRGGHFPMLEVPDAYIHEVQKSLGPLPLL